MDIRGAFEQQTPAKMRSEERSKWSRVFLFIWKCNTYFILKTAKIYRKPSQPVSTLLLQSHNHDLDVLFVANQHQTCCLCLQKTESIGPFPSEMSLVDPMARLGGI